ncbi:aspergillopepsin-2 heavy chain [Diaporthe amygdali]|uniref:aspergillopepsin-2 heavy chain n=1 Tax=Phomopsis amygdali TaxID=1214568 RepID=UPI0022FE5B51|nr:aspergillopepsin-2 heavy chain [Diaporthe amygdali]KAJ0104283.1 aspergillopepsin-2 heavy chain [Diaporthe amygdali]
MKSAVILSALFAAALAAPSPDAVARSLARRKAARAQRAQHSKPRVLAAAADDYNENWAGAVLTGKSVTAASGSFPVLKAAVPTSKEAGEKEYTASAWVGLDGYDCNGLWQAGVDSIVESSGETSFYAWYEWYPADTQVVDLGEIAAGDVINVELTAASTTEASVVLENKTNGKKFTKTVTSSDALCGTAAEWILEDVTFQDSNTGLANFGSVTFSGISATVGGAATSSISDAVIMDIQDTDNNILTSSKVSGSTVVVTYDS